MKLLIFMLSIFVFQNNNSKLFIYESAPKKFGKSYIGFIEVQNSKIEKITEYKFLYDKTKIKQITKTDINFTEIKYNLDNNGKLSIPERGIFGYSEEFFTKNSLNTKKFYLLIDKDFIELNNNNKKKIIDEIIISKTK